MDVCILAVYVWTHVHILAIYVQAHVFLQSMYAYMYSCSLCMDACILAVYVVPVVQVEISSSGSRLVPILDTHLTGIQGLVT